MLLRLLALALTLTTVAQAAPLDDAIALYTDKKYPEARAAFEKIATTEPTNAAAAHYLGLIISRRADAKALDEALPWLQKATTLEPKNPTYLFEYGGIELQLAQKNTSLSAASRGREAMEKAVALKPDYLDAREALFRYFTQAPFFAGGSSSKAAAQLVEIGKYDATRATVLSANTKVASKDYAEAFKILDDTLAKDPDNYAALYYYGRAAAISDLNLAIGLAHLQKCLTITPPTPSSPTYSYVWNRIGNLHEKLRHPAEARAAYETAVKLDAANKAAAESLAKLK